MASGIMWMLFLPLILAFAPADARSRFVRYRSWNSQMYPVWKEGDARYRDCWKGGEVTFGIRSDSPTLTGAKVTFNIDVTFPQNQSALPDGQVVWSRNCTVNGTSYIQGQSVYPESRVSDEWSGVFPDRTPFPKANKKNRFIYVWKTGGKYWQVADGPSSLLTLATDNMALGSYSMDVVIYHCRGKDKFIPLGYASTQFSITDQLAFAVTLSQVGDINQADRSFIQNRAVAFSIDLHDPSQYLSGSDISFNWDFGDNSGTLISRDTTVTHTYLTTGSFRPQVVLTAAISAGCQPNPTPAASVAPADPTAVEPAAVTESQGTAEDLVLTVPPDAINDLAVEATDAEANVVDAAVEDAAAETVETVAEATDDATNDLAVEATDTETNVDDDVAAVETVETVAADAAADATNDLAVEATDAEANVDDAAVQDAAVEIAETVTDATADATNDLAVETIVVDADAAAVQDAAVAVTVATAVEAEPSQEIVEAVANLAVTVLPASPAAEVQADIVVPTDAVVPAAEDAANQAAEIGVETEIVADVTSEPGAAELEAEVAATQAALVIAKRQAPAMAAETNCIVYRYGSFATSLNVVQAIESVEIVEVNNVLTLTSDLEQNAVDLTVTCQGSLPDQVCTVVSDADCISPLETLCNAVTPTPDCQLVLRQFFNDSGTFCINVSLTNDVSLAVTSARLSVVIDPSSSRNTAGAALGILVFICAVGALAFTYKRLKGHQQLHDENTSISFTSGISSMSSVIWNLLSRQSAAESRPLLRGGVV